jgi:type 1 glutamine amidotransferase
MTDIDGPFAREPYSADTLVADLMMDPPARAVLDRMVPELLRAPAAFGGGWLPQGMATILTPRHMLRSDPNAAELLARLGAELATIPLTAEAMLRRCARYDRVPPELPAMLPRPSVLVFDKTTGFRDEPSIAAAAQALRLMAGRRGWAMVFSDKGAVFNERDLSRFNAVVWNNVSGDALTIGQRNAFVDWVEAGGGFAGIHGTGGDPVCKWDWFADTLIGARFAGHPMPPRQFQAGRVLVETGHPITQGLGEGWTMTEEWYSFDRSPRSIGTQVLAVLDEASYEPVGLQGMQLRMGDHPLAWGRTVGQGRSFYTAIGHHPESYTHPSALRLLEQGIAWAMNT